MGLSRFPINDFRGGWNIRDNPAELDANETPFTQDFTLSPLIGQLVQRKGAVRWDTNEARAGPRGPILNMRRWIVARGETIELLMLSAAGTVWSTTGAGLSTRRFVGTAGTIWEFEPMRERSGRDYLWMVNGTDAPKKWDGITAEAIAWTNPPPTGCTMIKSWKNLMLAAGNSAAPYRLYFSSIGDPETGLSSNFVDIGTVDDDQDPIMDLNVFGDNLVILKRNSIWMLFDPVNMNNRRVGFPGCEGRFQSAEVDDRLYYFSRYGIYAVNRGGAIEEETSQIRPIFTGENEPVDQLNTARMEKVRVFSARAERILVAVPVNGETENNRLYELMPHMNFRRTGGRRYIIISSVMRHTLAVASMATLIPNTILAATRSEEKIWRIFSGNTEMSGGALVPRWVSCFRGIQEDEPIERIRRVNITYSGQCIVDVYKEFESEVPIFSRNVEPPGSTDTKWEGGEWDGGEWNALPPAILGRVRPESRARYHAIGIRGRDTAEEKPGIAMFSAELVYRGGKEH